MINPEAARLHWHPIAASSDLVPRHVFHAQLLGRELALWRADDGNVNAWENRCLHRGVRLSIGVNDGTELVCQYHGWRYANRTAGCTYIPAHPADAPARTICNNTYPVAEHLGLVWCSETPSTTVQEQHTLDYPALTPLRAIAVNAPLQQCVTALIDQYGSDAIAEKATQVRYSVDSPSPFLVRCTAESRSAANPDICFFLQPVDSSRTTLRGILCGTDSSSIDQHTLTALLRHHDNRLCQLRDAIEKRVEHQPEPLPWTAPIPRVSEAIASMPAVHTSARDAALRVRIAAIDSLTTDVRLFTLQALPDELTGKAITLPAAQPGAHIDVHLPNGMVRQYSLINGPGQTDHYAIAVKRLDDSTGGSQAMHCTLKTGDVLAVSLPRSNFPLRRDAEHTHLIAGGIGLTPLLSMARALSHARLPFTLHHFIRSASDGLFRQELLAMHGDFHEYIGQDAGQTRQTLHRVLEAPLPHHHVYLCGPPAMLGVARELASEHGWPDDTIHFEYFKNTRELDTTTPFTVELARSSLTLEIPADRTLLSVLREHNVGVPSSCEQGACGTCRIAVLDGQPDHQDVYLSDSEKQRGDCLMSCVSRAQSARLVLDL